MHHITIISFAFFCSAILKPSSADFSDYATLISPDDVGAGDLDVFDDSSGDFPEDFFDLPNNVPLDPGFDGYGDGLESVPTMFALDGCSIDGDRQLEKRIRVRGGPAFCPAEPTTSSDPPTNNPGDSNDNGNGNGNGNGNDFFFKNDDGIETEPKNALGLNRFGTNSDGTICPPSMWLLCSAVEQDLEGSCLGCYPCEFSGGASCQSVVEEENWLANTGCRSIHIFITLGVLSASEANSMLRGLQLHSKYLMQIV